MSGFAFDPFAPGYAEDPYPYYAALRDQAPAYQHPLGFWIVSRYADVARLQRSGHSVNEKHLTSLPAWKSDSAALGRENRMMRGLALLDQDPPNHTRLRRLVSQAFTPRVVAGLEPRIAELTEALLDRLAEAGRADIVQVFSFPLPFAVISDLLGVPVRNAGRIHELSGVLARGLEPMADPGTQAAIRSANGELTGLVAELAAWKRAHPADDLFSALIQAAEDGDKLTQDELIAQVMFLYVAGHETTANLIAGGLLSLLRHPAELAALHADPGLAAGAVEELLRYETPVHLMRRVTVAPLDVAGQQVPAGSWVIAALAAANRDPRFWGPDADELRLGRPKAHQNVSFGAGIHHCLGAGLARLEAEVAFARFAARFPRTRLEELRWNGRINVRGPAVLDVTVG